MTNLSSEAVRYISSQYTSGAWERVPAYLGLCLAFPSNSSKVFAVHKSLTQPGLIAFYDSVEKAEARRETIMKVGRFLTRFQPEFSQDEVRRLAERYQAEFNKDTNELTFATTADEIEDVYESGPNSCMSGPARAFDSNIHPARVYAAGDLAIAHIKTHSRVLCWPEKKIYGRIYGNTESDRDSLRQELEDLGYSYRLYGFEGAKLARIKDNGSFVMPYLDGAFAVVDKGDHFIMCRNDGIAADSTSGLLEEKKVQCHLCGESFRLSDSDSNELCEDCLENSTSCEMCGDYVHIDNSRYIEEESISLCEACYSNHFTRCEGCEADTRDENITEVGLANYCPACLAKEAVSCYTCGEYVLNEKATITPCGESYCDLACAESCNDCPDCETERDTITPGNTDENLVLHFTSELELVA